MAIARPSSAPTPLVQHACALVLGLIGSWGFDLSHGRLQEIDGNRLRRAAWGRDGGWLSSADLRGHVFSFFNTGT